MTMLCDMIVLGMRYITLRGVRRAGHCGPCSVALEMIDQ
jgi:hypothetical protein